MDMYFIKSTNKGYRSRPRGSEMPHADPPEEIEQAYGFIWKYKEDVINDMAL